MPYMESKQKSLSEPSRKKVAPKNKKSNKNKDKLPSSSKWNREPISSLKVSNLEANRKSEKKFIPHEFRISNPRVPSLQIPITGWNINPKIRDLRKSLLNFLSNTSKSREKDRTSRPLIFTIHTSLEESETNLKKVYPNLTLESHLSDIHNDDIDIDPRPTDPRRDDSLPEDWQSVFNSWWTDNASNVHSGENNGFGHVDHLIQTIFGLPNTNLNLKLIHRAALVFENDYEHGHSVEQAMSKASKFLKEKSRTVGLPPGMNSGNSLAESLKRVAKGFMPSTFDQATGHAPVSMKTRGDGVVHVHGEIPISTVFSDENGTAFQMELITGSTSIISANHFGLDADSLGGRLALITSLFSFVKYENFVIRYTPLVGTGVNVGANLAIGYAPDPGAGEVSTINSYAEAIQLDKVCTNSVWSPCELVLPVKTDWNFVEAANTDVSSERQVSPGSIFLFGSGPNSSGGPIRTGTISVEFNVQLRCPTVTYGLTLCQTLFRQYSKAAIEFLFEKLIVDETTVFDLLKQYDYPLETPVSDEILRTLKLCGFVPKFDPCVQRFFEKYRTYLTSCDSPKKKNH